jgi:hypothetical protein
MQTFLLASSPCRSRDRPRGGIVDVGYWVSVQNKPSNRCGPLRPGRAPHRQSGRRWRRTDPAKAEDDESGLGLRVGGSPAPASTDLLRPEWEHCVVSSVAVADVLNERKGDRDRIPCSTVITPTSTVRDRKSARKPSFKTRATNRRSAVGRATMPTSAIYFSLASGAMRESEAERSPPSRNPPSLRDGAKSRRSRNQ